MSNARREALSRTTLLVNREFFAGAANEEALADALAGLSVRIVGDASTIAQSVQQTLAVTVVGLLARMGFSVETAVPEVELAGPQPPLTGPALLASLEELGRDLIPGVTVSAATQKPFLTFVLGDSICDEPALRLYASDWTGVIAPEREAHPLPTLPFGALAVAAAAAAEALRAALPRLAEAVACPLSTPHRIESPGRIEIDLGELFPALRDLDSASLAGLDLGRVDFISGGAITQSCVYTLLRLPHATIDGRVVEAETLDLSNLNRYALSRRSHIDEDKIDILAAVSNNGFEIEGVPLRFDEQSREQLVALAARVAVGVDHIPSRWLIQAENPLYLCVGSTQSLEVVVSRHRPGEACAGCLHPEQVPDQDAVVATISFVSFWAGFLQALYLICDVVGGEPAAQVVTCWPLGWEGATLLAQPLTAQPRCPIRCGASQRQDDRAAKRESHNRGA